MRLSAAEFRERIHRHLFGETGGLPGQGVSGNLNGIDVYRTLLSTDAFPMAYQVYQPGLFPDLLLVSPALADFGGLAEGSNIGIEFWQGNQFTSDTWKSSYSAPTGRCFWRQVANQIVHVPWGRECVFVVRFVLLTGQSAAAGNTMGVSIVPWTP